MSGNHFRILNARMVQSVESVWTVLNWSFNFPIFFLQKLRCSFFTLVYANRFIPCLKKVFAPTLHDYVGK